MSKFPLFFSILTSSLLIFFTSCNQYDVNPIIEKIKSEYAPDKRVAIFDISTSTKNKEIILEGETNLPTALDSLVKLLPQEATIVNKVNILPDSTLNGNIFGVVNISVGNIRSNPKHSAELATQAILGTPLKVLKSINNDWYLVQTPDQYIGWLDKGGFELMTETQFRTWQSAPKVIYINDYGFSYDTIGPSASRVSDLITSNILKSIGIEEDYAHVEYPDGRQAYIKGDEIMAQKLWNNTRTVNAENILKSAQRYMGRPYLWGGTSGKAMDCSGFTKTVFFENGWILPRDASQQVNIGEEVEITSDLSNFKQGDLLFFGRKATEGKKEKITHVAIYMGNGKIIHATGRVKIESLVKGDVDFAEERLKSLVRVKRIINIKNPKGVIPAELIY